MYICQLIDIIMVDHVNRGRKLNGRQRKRNIFWHVFTPHFRHSEQRRRGTTPFRHVSGTRLMASLIYASRAKVAQIDPISISRTSYTLCNSALVQRCNSTSSGATTWMRLTRRWDCRMQRTCDIAMFTLFGLAQLPAATISSGFLLPVLSESPLPTIS